MVTAQDARGRQLVLTLLLDLNQLGSLLVTDVDASETAQYFFPESTRSDVWAAWAPYASLSFRNGRFYTFAGKTLLEFDLDRREFTFHGVPAPTESCYTGAAMVDGPDGRIYAGSHPNARLVAYDPTTHEMTDHGPMDPVEHYPDNFAVDAVGWIYCGLGTARWNIVAFNPQTRELRPMVAENDRGLGTARVCTGRTERFTARQATCIAGPRAE